MVGLGAIVATLAVSIAWSLIATRDGVHSPGSDDSDGTHRHNGDDAVPSAQR